MTTSAAEFIDVSKTYRGRLHPTRGVVALREVSFGIEPGEAVALSRPEPGRQDHVAQDSARAVQSLRG